MTAITRLDIDLTFSLAEPDTPDSAAEAMQGTIRASGTEVEIFTSNPELFVQGSAAMLRHVRHEDDVADVDRVVARGQHPQGRPGVLLPLRERLAFSNAVGEQLEVHLRRPAPTLS